MFFSCTQHSLVEPYNVLAANKSVSRLLVKRILLVLIPLFSNPVWSFNNSDSYNIESLSFLYHIFNQQVKCVLLTTGLRIYRQTRHG